MEEDGMRQVPVARRTEVRRRIAILDAFLALPSPDAEDRAAARERIGVSRSMFEALLRIRRETTDPAALPGARVGSAERAVGGQVAQDVALIINASLADLGASATGSNLIREVKRRCDAAGVRAPSAAHLRKRLREHRARDPLVHTGRPLLAIDFCMVDPGSARAGARMPVVAAAMLVPERRIVAARTIWSPPSAAVAAKVLSTALAEFGAARAVALPKLGGLAIDALDLVVAHPGIPTTDGKDRQSAVSRIFRLVAGETLGGLRLLPGRTMLELEATAIAPEVRQAVGVLVHEAVDEHNGRLDAHGRYEEPVSAPASVFPLLAWIADMPSG